MENKIPRFFDVATVTNNVDPEGKGRVMVKLEETGIDLQTFIPVCSTVYSSADNGWHGTLGLGDRVLIKYIDYPEKQHPIVDSKMMTRDSSLQRIDEETLKIKEHTVKFETDKVTISHSSGMVNIIMNPDSIEIQNNGLSTFSSVRGEALALYLKNHIHIGNLGYITATPEASGYPFLDDVILNDKNKLS
jgi:hypothetical protein